MATALYCDRCNKYSLDEPFGLSSPNGNWNISICQICFKQYEDWIKEGKDATNKG